MSGDETCFVVCERVEMPDTTARHGAIFVKAIAEELIARGYDRGEIFADTGIDPGILSEEKPVSGFASIAAFFEKWATQLGNDILGFQYGQASEMRRSGLICYVGLSSPTVLDFYRNIARYRRVFSDAMEMEVDQLETTGVLTWYSNVPQSVNRRQFVEFSTAGALAALRQSVGKRIVPQWVTFKHARNTNLEAFEQFFGCDVQFGAPVNSLRFRSDDLALPLQTADNELYLVLMQCCEDVLKRKSALAPNLVLDVERAITDRLCTGEATQFEVAGALGMSPRTLSRKLAKEGTTFFRTLEDLRKSLAISYLRDSNLVLAEISYLLGYAGLSSFNDAFKRWTGQSPGQYRNL